MKDLRQTIQDTLGKQLDSQGYEVDLVQVPPRGDRMVRIRTLEEAIEDFDLDASGNEVLSYLIQVKPKHVRESQASNAFTFFDEEPSVRTPTRVDGIYLPDGKVNVPFLQKNADLLFSSGEYALARNIYKTILSTGERSHAALFAMARCFENEGRIEEARSHYEEALTYQGTLETYEHLAAVLIRLRKDQEAAELIERALTIKELSREKRLDLQKSAGNCWMRAGKPEQAEKLYRKSLELDPQSDSLHSLLGTIHLQASRISEAKACFHQAIALNPSNDKALAGLGTCYFSEGDKRSAHDYLARALLIDVNNPTAIFQLVKCAYEIKSYAVAAKMLGEYIEIAPINANLLYSLAGLQFHLGRIPEARATARKVLGLQPEHPGATELVRMTEQY